MAALSYLARFKSGRSKTLARSKARAAARSKPRNVEMLEGRQLLSTLLVKNHHESPPRSIHPAIVETAKPATRATSGNHAVAPSAANTSVTYYSTSHVSLPVSAWTGLRAGNSPGQYFISGISKANGLLFVGSLQGVGKSYSVWFPQSLLTSVYGPDNLGGNRVRLVGSYRNPTYPLDPVDTHGFIFQGTTGQLTNPGRYRTIDMPGATYNFTHSTMGGLAVGNYDGPLGILRPLGPGKDYIYNVATGKFVASPVFPGSVSNTAYGIWYNGGTSYTIAGGYSNVVTNNMTDQNMPIGKGYLVDYNSATGKFSHWTSFSYPFATTGANYFTHFEGISSVKKGVYTLAADSGDGVAGDPIQGSFVTVQRMPNGTFGNASWVNLNYPGTTATTSANSVYGNHAVGVVLAPNGVAYQAAINP